MTPPQVAPLVEADRASIRAIACHGNPVDVLRIDVVDASDVESGPFPAATVTCRMPALPEDVQARSTDYCDKRAESWSCRAGLTTISMKLFSRQRNHSILADRPDVVAASQALRCFARRATDQGREFGGTERGGIWIMAVTVNVDGSSIAEGYYKSQCVTFEIGANCESTPEDLIVKSTLLRGVCWDE